MTLHEWMTLNGKRNFWLAEAVPVHLVTVSKWRTGRSVPLPWYRQRLEELTEGAVKASDWPIPDPAAEGPRRGSLAHHAEAAVP